MEILENVQISNAFEATSSQFLSKLKLVELSLRYLHEWYKSSSISIEIIVIIILFIDIIIVSIIVIRYYRYHCCHHC